MNKVRSEILFNRALIWLLMVNVEAVKQANDGTTGKVLMLFYLILMISNFAKSAKAWAGINDD